MAGHTTSIEAMPVVRDLADFDQKSGNALERIIFNNRGIVIGVCAVITAFLAFVAVRVTLNASYEKMLPQGHPYVANYLANKNQLRGLGNTLRVVVENTQGDIFDPAYLEALRKINDELFLTPGVDRAWVKSLWTPAVRWTEVTEEGFQGGPVMPDTYDGSPKSVEQLRANVARAGLVGSLVANDFKSSTIVLPLLDVDPVTGKAIDYGALSKMVEQNVRAKFETPDGKIKIRIIGFAKIIGELLDGVAQVMMYFGIAFAIAAALLYYYTRCWRSTALVLGCSMVAVAWQTGILTLIGIGPDPFSVLVPFLVFAIGVSHGAQKMNGIMQDIGRGTQKLVAARYTFRRLFVAGVTALLNGAAGFLVLLVIPIPAIRELAISATIGVFVLLFTNLVLLPVLLSYTGVGAKAAARSVREEEEDVGAKGIWGLLDHFAERRSWALGAIGVALALGIGGFVVSKQLQIGDLDPGAPELRPNSRYNVDNAFITKNFSLSSDVFAVIVKTPKEGCLRYDTLQLADRLAWQLQQLPEVQTTVSLADVVKQITAGSFEGSPKWLTLSRNQEILNYGAQQATVNNPDLFNTECSVMPVIAYLKDHKAATLDKVAATVQQFIADNPVADVQLLPAAGSAGIEAAVNQVVRKAWIEMLFYIYGVVAVLCLIAFRSWRAVIVALLPLALTSILCEALMVVLGIGVKVATLPVIALGVGIGVDYALYLLSVQLHGQRMGLSLTEAYRSALAFTGRIVALVGFTLAAGVVTWAFSPIKFQADMGILLAFMFLLNMIGALVLIPSLSYFLLPTSAFQKKGDKGQPLATPATA
ncbi:MAG TPA: MMPL family transporter [Burkholderiaceae bacterium]|nr:MMPL family transporter [Burkholderiaceae bacterium]HQR70786.1 MMPL family transporter [Burkholderiaceae bacterium]